MNRKRKIEIFSAGCPACEDAISLVTGLAHASSDVSVLDMNDDNVADRAKRLGIRSIPAVVVDGQLASCCQAAGVTSEGLEASGVGKPPG